jgi:hypothetical protein
LAPVGNSWRSATLGHTAQRADQRVRHDRTRTPLLLAEPDLRELLDEELSLLPERDRRVILLCALVPTENAILAVQVGLPRAPNFRRRRFDTKNCHSGILGIHNGQRFVSSWDESKVVRNVIVLPFP